MELKSIVFSTTFSRDFMRLKRKVDAHSISILLVLKDLNRYALKQAENSFKKSIILFENAVQP